MDFWSLFGRLAGVGDAMKYILGLAVLMSVWCYYLNYRIDVLKKENTTLQAEKNSLCDTIREYKNAQVEANNEIKNLRKKISVDKTALDWYREPLPKNIYDVINGD